MDSSSMYHILYEDKDIIVIHKMPGVAVQSGSISKIDIESLLKKYLKDSTGSDYLGIVHRLDQPVEGILVFAKNSLAAADLSKQVTGDNKDMEKLYKALVYGYMPEDKGQLVDMLYKDTKASMAKVITDTKSPLYKQAKKARLGYEVIKEDEKTQLLKINLETGRFHQIRCQLSNIGCPILGDLKYGNQYSIEYAKATEVSNIALTAYSLSFNHPVTKKRMSFTI